MANTETEESYFKVFRDLKGRGLRGVRLVISDDHGGLRSAINRYFQGAEWQRCQVHFLRNLLDLVPRKNKEKIAEEIKSIFNSPDIYLAILRVNELVKKYKNIYPKLSEKLEEEIEETLTYFHFPVSHRRRIRTTNSLERLNEEIKRRTRVIRIFPNEASCLRLVCALAIEKSEEWITGRRCLNMDELYEGENEIIKVDPEGILTEI